MNGQEMNEALTVDEGEILTPDAQVEIPEDEGTATVDAADNENAADGVDYGELLREDERTLTESFKSLPEDFKITDLCDPIRYGALRDLGLSPREAFLATGGIGAALDNRAHLTRSISGGAVKRSADIPRAELRIAREIFSDMSEGELQKLYRRVNG